MTDHGLPIAEYLAGELDAERTAVVDEHLVGCDACWSEVQVARLGRLAAQRTTETAPDEVRRRAFARLVGATEAVPVSGSGQRRISSARAVSALALRHRRRVVVAVAAAAAAVLTFGSGLLVGHHTSRELVVASLSPSSAAPASTAPAMGTLAAALSYYRLAMLPGTGIATVPAPDLRTLGLQVAGASNGTLAAQPVTAYAYRSAAGSREIYVFESSTPFRSIASPGAPPETRSVRGYTVFSSAQHPMIIVGRDPALVGRVGARLS